MENNNFLKHLQGKTHCKTAASVNLLVPLLADIKTTFLLLDVSALLTGVSPSLYTRVCCCRCSDKTLHQFLRLEEAFQMLHLPDAGDDEDECLSDGPPENTLVGALARHAKPLLAIPLVVLLLLDLFNLVE